MKGKEFKISSFAIIITFTCLSIIGVSLIPLLNIQLKPSYSIHGFSVFLNWNNASPRVIEHEVTSKLEGLFNSVKGIENISSISKKGSGRIDLRFKKSANLDLVRFEIANLIRQSYYKLPQQLAYPQLSLNASGEDVDPLISYTLNANESPFEVQKYAEKYLTPLLSSIKGISKVQIYGGVPYKLEIEFEFESIKNLGLTGDEVSKAISDQLVKKFLGKANILVNGSFAEETPLTFEFGKPEAIDWEKIVLKKTGKRVIFLRDVAVVKLKEQLPFSYFRINGLNSINIVIYAAKGENNIHLARRIKKSVNSLSKELPNGYSLVVTYDSTEYLTKELSKITIRILVGLVLLLLFVLIFSKKLNYLLFIVISLLVNLSIASIFYYLFNIEIQLYSLAGLTISFGFITDNCIVMVDHYSRMKNKRVFLAMLGSALTIIGTLSIIFFLTEEQKASLEDFALVVLICLCVSLSVSLFFIPALIEKLDVLVKNIKFRTKFKRRIASHTLLYRKFILFNKKWKWIYVVVFVLSFGVPLQWLPDKLEKNTLFATEYNKTWGNEYFKAIWRPKIEAALGGSLRLFTNEVIDKSYYSEPNRTQLNINCAMPEGCTVQQLNDAIRKIENFISKFGEVEMYQTSINNYKNGRIKIFFKPQYEFSSFPHQLKSELESQAINLGGADWSIYGVGQGFSNSIYPGLKNSKIYLEGYNYEDLHRYAVLLMDTLLTNPRVKEVDILGSDDFDGKSELEYSMSFTPDKLTSNKLTSVPFFMYLKDRAYQRNLPDLYYNQDFYSINIISDTYEKFNVWGLKNEPIAISNLPYKMSQFGSIEKRQGTNNIYKNNQQYQLLVAYNFVGNDQLSTIIRNTHIKLMNGLLPLGYKAFEKELVTWDKNDRQQYLLILLALVFIYVVTAILFESLLQPLAIIATIPISFIGTFLTFYLFKINFDQGGFAALLLLCGVVVSAGLYIINDFNNFEKKRENTPKIENYLKAFNFKIRPILLVLLSNILALLPFIFDGKKEVFWYAFAAGSLGGLVFSIIGIIIFLPIFLNLKGSKTESK